MASSIHLSKFPLPLLFSLSLILSSLLVCASDHQFKSDGKLLELDDSNFDSAISKFDFILAEFYAPWCGHCQRLTPELQKAAPVLGGLNQPIVVAKIDADKHRKIASKYNIGGFPTLKIFMHGTPTDYYGPRKADSLIRILRKFVAPDVTVLSSDTSIRGFIDSAGSDFPIFIGFGLNESAIMNVAVRYKKKAWFSVAKDFSNEVITMYGFDKVPALTAILPAYNEHSTFYGPFEEKFLEDNIKQSLLPLVLPLNQDSLKLLRDDDRKVVVTILDDETAEKSQRMLEILKATALTNRDLIFSYVGVEQWKSFTESFEVNKKTQLPKIVVWDGAEVYYSVNGYESIDEKDMGRHVTRFLEGYREGNITEKRINVSTLQGWEVGIIVGLIVILVLVAVLLILFMIKEEAPMAASTRKQLDELHGTEKED